MITIRISGNDPQFCIEAQGHALFDKKGKDVVCAAVSTLLQSWLIGTQQLCGTLVQSEQKSGYFIAYANISNDQEELLYRSLYLGLVILEQQYPQNIKVTREDSNGRR